MAVASSSSAPSMLIMGLGLPARAPERHDHGSGRLLKHDQHDAALRAEREAYGRRLEICTKLRQVAFDKNDDALARQVDDLERQASNLYNQRVEALGVPKVKVPLPSPSAMLDRELGTGVAVNPLTAPVAPQSADSANRTASRSLPVREVQP